MQISICKEYYTADNLLHPGTTQIHGIKYIRDGDSVAVIFRYTKVDSTVIRSLRMLRIANVIYNAT